MFVPIDYIMFFHYFSLFIFFITFIISDNHAHCQLDGRITSTLYNRIRCLALCIHWQTFLCLGCRRGQGTLFILLLSSIWAYPAVGILIFPHPHLASVLRKGGFLVFIVLFISFLLFAASGSNGNTFSIIPPFSPY